MQTPEEIEQINKRKFEEDYSPSQTSINKTLNELDYSHVMIEIKLELIRKYGHSKKVLDIGCGTGDYLFESYNVIGSGVGIDFTEKMLREAIRKKKSDENFRNNEFICCNAKHLPFKKGSFDLCYSYATLYCVPKVELAVLEMSRVLKSNSGVAILGFGNLISLNTIVCKAYPEWAVPCHITTKQMKKIIERAGFEIIEWRAFQILPLWGDRPKWLRPLLHPAWKRILQKKIKDKMIDEWISNAPFFKKLAFRHIIVCRKK